MGSTFYVTQYIAKSKIKIEHVLSTILAAWEHVHNPQFASAAEDSVTLQRTVQHWWTHTLNKLDSMLEIADTRAAEALLTLCTEVCSDSFCIVPVYQSFNFVSYRRHVSNPFECNLECSISDDSEYSDSLSDFLASESNDSTTLDEKNSNHDDDNDDISRCSSIMSWSVTSKDIGIKIDADRQAHTDDLVEPQCKDKMLTMNAY
eukprot:15353969-Ditylum_brightwellii.AAC.1